MLRLGTVRGRSGCFTGARGAAPAGAALRHAAPLLLLARPAAAAAACDPRQLATRAAAPPLSMALIKQAAAEIDAALRKGDLEQMKARSASLFLEQYNERATSFGDAAQLLKKEPEFIGGLLQTCVETGRLATARSLFASVEATPDYSPDAAAYSAMILGYCAQRVPDRAVPVLRAAMAAGVELDDPTWVHSQLIHTLGTCGRLHDAEALLPDLTAIYGSQRPPSPLPRVLYRRLVQACSQSGELEKALWYADEMELMYTHQRSDARQQETLVGYLISGCFQSRNPQTASRLLQWLAEEIPSADGGGDKRRYTLVEGHYSQLIRLFGAMNSPTEAMQVLKLMQEDIGASADAYNGVLQGHARNYGTNAATGLFDKMVERTDGAPRPNVRTFNTMIEVFGHARQLNKSFEYFRMISDEEFRLEPDTRSYANLIGACGNSRRLAEAEAVFAEMKTQRIRPDDMVYRELIKAAGRRKDAERAWELFDEMLDEHLIVPDVRTYAALIFASSSTGDASRAFEAYDHLLAEGLLPNLSVFNSLIYVCGEVRDMEGAFRVLKEMGRVGVPPDVRCYTRLLRACGVDAESRGGKAGAEAGGMESGKASDGVENDLSSELVAGLADKEEDVVYAQSLLATLERIKAENLPRNKALYLALLRSSGRARQARLVFRVFEEMKREGIRPDATVYTHLLNACRQCGRLSACEAVFEQMKELQPPLGASTGFLRSNV